jgi:hypothetical protein
LRTLLALNPHTKIRHYGISMSIEIFDISDLSPEKIKALIDSRKDVMMMAATLNSNFIGRDYWRDKAEYERMRRRGSFKGSSDFFQVLNLP